MAARVTLTRDLQRARERESTAAGGRGAVTPRLVSNLKPTEAGVDTFKLSSYVAHERSIRALVEGQPTKRTAGGSVLVLGDDGEDEWPLCGARTLFYPATSLLAVEGHPSGARGVLAAPDDVPGWCEDVRDAFADRGVRLDDRLGVARLDAAVTVETDPKAGAAVMAGVAAVVPPRAKLETFRGRTIETVYYVTERGRKLARCYDSGRAYETAEPLTRIRFEDQRRYDRPARRLDARTVTTANVRDAFCDRWGVLRKATKGVTVASVPVAVDKLGVMYETGAISWAQAERALGATLLLRSGARPASRVTEWRRRNELRELGVVLLEGELEPVEVNLSETIERVCDAAVWGA